MACRLATLAEIEAAVWAELEFAAGGASRSPLKSVAQGRPHDPSHPWRTPVLATADGVEADARTVVLRRVDARQRRLTVFTDRRAGKVAQLSSHPRAVFVMWSPALGWQLRCRAALTLRTTGADVALAWARIERTAAADDYLAGLPPGAPLDAGQRPGPGRSIEGRTQDSQPAANFAVIEAQVESVDWLELHRDGHRRAIFTGTGARWVQP